MVQLIVNCWFGLGVWIPRIPLWKGLLLRGIPRIPNHQPKPPITVTISWMVVYKQQYSFLVCTGHAGASSQLRTQKTFDHGGASDRDVPVTWQSECPKQVGFLNLSTGWNWMSNEKDPSCLGYIGDYTTQLYRDYNKTLQDPYWTTRIMDRKKVFFVARMIVNDFSLIRGVGP